MGRLVDEHVECAYPGLRFDCSGKRTFNPHGSGFIPPKAVVRSYPLIQRYALLRIWRGDAAMADPGTIPKFDLLADPAFRNVRVDPRSRWIAADNGPAWLAPR